MDVPQLKVTDMNNQFPFAGSEELVLLDIDFMWSDGGGGWSKDFIDRYVAQHWCREELECLMDMVHPKGYRFGIGRLEEELTN